MTPLNAENAYQELELGALTSVFGKARDKVVSQVTKALKENSTSWSFYQDKLDLIDNVLSVLKVYWNKFTGRVIPDNYDHASTVTANVLDAAGLRQSGTISARVVDKIMQDMVADMHNAIDGGINQVETLFRRTQQTALKEQEIDRHLAQGLVQGGDIPHITDAIADDISEKIGDGKLLEVNGKMYDPESYAELVARTRTREAQSQAAKDTIQSYGEDLIMFSSHGSDTQVCLDNGGESEEVFSLSGDTPGYEIAGDLPPWHPNCQHVVIPVVFSPSDNGDSGD